jgi:hypothetical protein
MIIAAERAGDDQYASGDSPADRRGTHRRSRSATAQAPSATPRSVRAIAGDHSAFDAAIVGLSLK